MEYYSQRQFAKLAGVSHAAVVKARKDGRVHRTVRGYDPEHPTNKHYLNTCQGRKSGEIQPAKSKAVSAREKARKRAPKPDKEYKPPGIDLNQLPEMPLEIENGNSEDQELKEVAGRITKVDADTWKRIEEIKKLQLARQEKRRELIPRVLIQRVFNRIYQIDTNQLRTLGDRVSPEIASLCGVNEQDTIIQIGRVIDSEINKTLKHIQRLIEEFLKGIHGELTAEQKEIVE